MIKSSELDFKPVLDPGGQLKKGTVGPWTCDRYECTGDMQLQTFRKGTGDNLLAGLSMKVRCSMRMHTSGRDLTWLCMADFLLTRGGFRGEILMRLGNSKKEKE